MRHGSIESFFLQGQAGRLEALLNLGVSNAQYACVICHPHPLYGSTMHNKVVFHAMKALNAFGFPVLRFNFRGVGKSEGKHDSGHGEADDVKTALDYMAERFSLPIIFAGFSFGAAIGLRAAVPHPQVKALIALGIPLSAEGRDYSYALLRESNKSKLLLSGGRDEFARAELLDQVAAEAAEPKRVVVISGADHFFTGHLEEMQTALNGWVREVLGY
ncbi:MAG: alpha/beta hydrolase [Acidobacteria bacterium]|nr:MAG: alpha/beta hydrolase [Acidobacteriota bacterium]